MKNMNKGFTLLELLVVVMIISLLATMITGVYNKEVENARKAVALSDIKEMSMAAERFKIDVGRYPYSVAAPDASYVFNNGYFHAEVVYGKEGTNPGELTPVEKSRWNGPYLNIQQSKVTSSTLSGSGYDSVVIIDPWGSPYSYATANKTDSTIVPSGPFAGETYNKSGVQIFSLGPNGVTNAPTNSGLDEDDITNFSM